MTEEEIQDKFFEKLKILNQTIWENKATKIKIENWLSNFKNSKEKINALYLLSHFIYFNKFMVKNLMISIFRDLYSYSQIHDIRKLNGDTIEESFIKTELQKRLSQTRFVSLGNPAESSASLLYIFRTENNLNKDLFIYDGQLNNLDNNITNLVFIDDICGSGNQAVEYSKAVAECKKKHPKIKIYYYMMVSTQEGKDYIKKHSKFDCVDSILEMDDSYKSFHELSRVYNLKDNQLIDKNYTEKFIGKYGKELMATIIKRKCPDIDDTGLDASSEASKFGYCNGQLLIGFEHNTPDNTLPVFWYGENIIPWAAIFKRHNKVY